MADLTRMSEQALQKEIEQATKVRNEIEAADSREVVRSGKADEVLARLESAGKTFTAAKAELARRSKAEGNYLQASSMFARQQTQLDSWAYDPTPLHERERERGRSIEPDVYEPVRKVFHLLRNSLPAPLLWEEVDGARLSVEEAQELSGLTLRSMKGAMTASEAPRWEELLEKTADRPTGSIARARQYEAERRAQDAEEAAAEREAQRQRDAERERRFLEMGVPRL